MDSVDRVLNSPDIDDITKAEIRHAVEVKLKEYHSSADKFPVTCSNSANMPFKTPTLTKNFAQNIAPLTPEEKILPFSTSCKGSGANESA